MDASLITRVVAGQAPLAGRPRSLSLPNGSSPDPKNLFKWFRCTHRSFLLPSFCFYFLFLSLKKARASIGFVSSMPPRSGPSSFTLQCCRDTVGDHRCNYSPAPPTAADSFVQGPSSRFREFRPGPVEKKYGLNFPTMLSRIVPSFNLSSKRLHYAFSPRGSVGNPRRSERADL